MNWKKVITILNYIAVKRPNVSKLEVCKLLYFFDKEHLIDYGRVVTEDIYFKLPLGTVPTNILNFINCPDDFIGEDKELREYLNKNISIGCGSHKNISSCSDPDLDELSISEEEVLNFILEKYKNASPNTLVDLTHDEFSWINAIENQPISFEAMLNGVKDPTKKKHLVESNNEFLSLGGDFAQLCRQCQHQ